MFLKHIALCMVNLMVKKINTRVKRAQETENQVEVLLVMHWPQTRLLAAWIRHAFICIIKSRKGQSHFALLCKSLEFQLLR